MGKKHITTRFSFVFFLLFAALNLHGQNVVSCASDGVTDVTSCLQNTINTIGVSGNRQVFLHSGTYLVSQTLVIPDKVQIIGVGRGDPNTLNTVIKASPTFPMGATVVQMGSGNNANFNVQISNLTIDGYARAGACLADMNAEELSWGRSLMLTNCAQGLLISGNNAQNSGPFQDLEIYPFSMTSGAATCVTVVVSPGFRGVNDVTCNGVNNFSQPSVGISLDGGGSYSNFHVEHFATGISLGNSAAAAGMVVSGAEFGPSVGTGIHITNNSSNQNITLLGTYGYNIGSLIQDDTMNVTVTDASIGFYMIGNGGGSSKPFLTSKIGLGNRFFGNTTIGGGLAIGNGDWHTETTLSVYDGTAAGVTSVLEISGANQGSTHLHEWRDPWNNAITFVDANAVFHTSNLQLGQVTQPACNASTRGTMAFVPGWSGKADGMQVCAKAANDSYNWVTVF